MQCFLLMYARKLGEKVNFHLSHVPQIFDTLCNIWLRVQSACSLTEGCIADHVTVANHQWLTWHSLQSTLCCVRTNLAINKTDVFFTIQLSLILFRNSPWIRLPFTHGPNISLMYCDLLGAFPTLTFIHSFSSFYIFVWLFGNFNQDTGCCWCTTSSSHIGEKETNAMHPNYLQ